MIWTRQNFQSLLLHLWATNWVFLSKLVKDSNLPVANGLSLETLQKLLTEFANDSSSSWLLKDIILLRFRTTQACHSHWQRGVREFYLTRPWFELNISSNLPSFMVFFSTW
jgi:hypothetical protein